jgi:DNA-binding NtrC family response regulator
LEVIAMKESILKNKMILAVDEELDILSVMEEEVLEACPNCKFHKTTNYYEAIERMVSRSYDMVILDISAVRGLELAQLAVRRKLPVAMLTAHPVSLEAFRDSAQIKTQTYLPKERLGEIVPFLEDVLKDQYGKVFYGKLG